MIITKIAELISLLVCWLRRIGSGRVFILSKLHVDLVSLVEVPLERSRKKARDQEAEEVGGEVRYISDC